MATRLPKLSRFIPLWKRQLPKYPLHWKGDPQLRVFTPLFWMKCVKSEETLPPDHVRFEVHPEMTVYDVKNYLEKIYQIDVQSVNTFTLAREEKKHPLGYTLRKEIPKRIAMVQLAEGENFEFPEIFGEKKTDDAKLGEDYKKLQKSDQIQAQKHWDKVGIPSWFR